jgi:hypothetical protein
MDKKDHRILKKALWMNYSIVRRCTRIINGVNCKKNQSQDMMVVYHLIKLGSFIQVNHKTQGMCLLFYGGVTVRPDGLANCVCPQ